MKGLLYSLVFLTAVAAPAQAQSPSGTLAKIRTLRRMIDATRPGCELEVDGGIDHETAPLVIAAGASVLVAGTSIYGSPEGVAAAMARLRGAVGTEPAKPA